ncbi:DEAD/DEAH box helicase, putative, partial [Hepatocystis sp. ex Piliocolobus tephrosceles]
SGKTVIGELCILRNLRLFENERSVYICPMKAIVNERYKSWKQKFEKLFKKKVIELTGECNVNKESLKNSNIIICTPEKLDVISRNWSRKEIIKNINLIIFDEIHLLGQENRGGVIEVLVNRFKDIEQKLNKRIRLVGLTTVITSVDDLMSWMNVKEPYMFNFPSSCRQIPCETHILGFTQKAYCARMSVMNKNVYEYINQYAQIKNVLIFVSSRRQTRLTAYDIIYLNISGGNLKFLHTEQLLKDPKHFNFLKDLYQNLSKKENKHRSNTNDHNWQNKPNINDDNEHNKYKSTNNIHTTDHSLYFYRENTTNSLHTRTKNTHTTDNLMQSTCTKHEQFEQLLYLKSMKIKNLSDQEKEDIENLFFQNFLNAIENADLKEVLKYGIGIHHAGLNESDKNIVEYLFLNKIIQILVCTSTLAWGINLPAYLVIIKGNEYYDAKTKKYKDITNTDLLQMIGRAGRPQFDNKALAVLLVQENKKNAIKNFLYHPMNIESNLIENLNEHVNAEICSNVIKTNEDFFNYVTNSYYFKRVFSNPSYYIKETQYVQLFENYQLSLQAKKTIYNHLNQIITNTIDFLKNNKCIRVVQEYSLLKYYPTPLAYIASMYYVKCETVYFFYEQIKKTYPCTNKNDLDIISALFINENGETLDGFVLGQEEQTVDKKQLDHSIQLIEGIENKSKHGDNERVDNELVNNEQVNNERFDNNPLNNELTFYELFELIAQAKEFDDVPLRHNEDNYNVKLSKYFPLDINMNMPNVKTYLLLLSRLYKCKFETVDYHIDLKLVLDQIARVINAFIDICLLFYKYKYIKTLILIFQCINQKITPDKNSLYIIKNINDYQISKLKELQIYNIKQLIQFDYFFLHSLNLFDDEQLSYIFNIPVVTANVKVYCTIVEDTAESNNTNSDENGVTNANMGNCNNNVNGGNKKTITVPIIKYDNNKEKYFFKIKHYEHNEIVIKIFFSIRNKVDKQVNSLPTQPPNVQWYSIFHDSTENKSIFIKRFNSAHAQKTSTVSFMLEDIEKGNFDFTIYIHNDTYYGLDDEIHLQLQVE